jgi:type I restriction enzyme M protein
LFLALFLRLLKTGGKAAVIVPDGVLFGSSKAHKDLRRMLVEEHKLDAVVELPSGVFRPYAGVSPAILFFTKTGVGGPPSPVIEEPSQISRASRDVREPLACALTDPPAPL